MGKENDKIGEHKGHCCQHSGGPVHYYSREQARKGLCCAACHDGESDEALEDMSG